MKTHELDIPEKKIKLTVSLPKMATAAAKENESLGETDPNQEPIASKEPRRPVNQETISLESSNLNLLIKELKSNTSAGIVSMEDLESSTANISEEKGNVEKEMMAQEEFCVVVETATGEEIEEYIVELYFENKKRSGGGHIKSCIKDGQQLIITFEKKEDALEVLQREAHSINKIALLVSRWQQQTAREQPQMSNSLVVLENVKENIEQPMLIMLLENASGLSEEDSDFSMEMIPEKNAVVITLLKSIDIDQFVKQFNHYRRVKEKNISARPLEVTRSIQVENIPPDISYDFISIYFESKKHGGGPVSDVNYIREDNLAVITFHNSKDVITVLAQKHFFNKVLVLVVPYYFSLGAALYGKERPHIPMPEPIRVPLNPYHWQFLQRNQWLLQEINHEMKNHFCEIEWPARHCALPEITLCPFPDLSKQKRSLIKSWNENVSARFAQILLKQKVIEYPVNAEVWEAIRNNIVRDDILILPDFPKGIIVLVGAAEATDHAAQEMKVLIDSAVKKIEREKQTIEETVSVAAGKYTILSNVGLQDSICSKYADLKFGYDASKELITLHGVATEVFKVKSDILERISRMVQITVDVHPHILLFLNKVDNGSLSQILFWAKKINAFYELNQETVLLTAVAHRDLLEAEKEIRNDLVYKCIELEDNSVIKMIKWRELTDHIYKAYNCSSDTIIIDEQEHQVVIAGCSKEVATANQKLSDFVDHNTYIQKTLQTKSTAVTMYVEEAKHSIWQNLIVRGVKIHFGTQTSHKLISLQGPRVEVMKGLDLFQKILSSLYATSVLVDKPGAKQFFREQEHLYVAGAKQQFNCLIRIQEGTDENDEEGGKNRNVYEGKQPCYEIKLGDGVVVEVHKADLTRYPVDVVVNASNEELKHIGGLADALSKTAGPQLQKECDELVRKHGSLKPGCAVITNAYNLPCKQVIHAVGPRWNNFEKGKCTFLLKKAVRESLRLAETYNHYSIAIPAVSSGIFAFPLKECAHAIVSAIKETFEESPGNGSLKQICLVDSREETVRAFSDALNEVLGNESFPSQPSGSKTDNYPRESGTEPQGITTSEGLTIIIQKKGIEDATTDVVVNSVAIDLELDKGPLSKALLGKAGRKLQVELTKQGHGKNLKEGCVLKTNGYGLHCSYVLHAILPAWDQGQTSQKILGEIINECLKITKQHSLKSITIPAVGTGNLRFPKPLVAKLMFDEVFKFSQKYPKSLHEVHFVLHPKDTDTIKAFTDTLNSRLNFDRTSSSAVFENFQAGEACTGHVSSSVSGGHKMQIGSIALQVECGDITQEATDAIVNVSNGTFNLKNGVSKAILDGAGPEIENECAQLASQPHNNLICTKGGKLGCKHIIHLAAQNDIKAQVSKALLECEQRKLTSVAFPAIGTGQAGLDPAGVADDMIDAIVDFATKTSAPVVKNIKIVIFQSHLQAVFFASMQKKEASANKPDKQPPKSVLSRITEFFSFTKPAETLKPRLLLERAIEPTIFQICGDSQKNVHATESWIKHLILKDQGENVVSDEWISNFGDHEYEKLRELQQKLHVVIKLEREASTPTLRVFGIMRDVLCVSNEIQKMIQFVREAQEEQSKADLFSNIVEWRYEDNGQYKPFDSLSNMHIESASQQRKRCSVTIENRRYEVNPLSMDAKDGQGRSITLRRVSKVEGHMALPEEWDDMQNMRVKVVEVKPVSKDYQDVQKMFSQTCQNFTIEKIERIQNPYYWQAYQVKKQEMDAKNGHANNEKLLFHGTASTTLTRINNSGFNRSYAGTHAAAYGNGTYFAVNANYSAHNTYSKPDANGKKYMYLARVLVGEYCVGSSGLVVPNPKSANDPTNLYDSVTDNMTNPSMFVIFNDIQAYPEYLITFK
ncbi:protein mono-ADP-ribosyltransferase PARP14-like isoform X2 [Hemicordylus capensis]|nr:protein mono-ADP-ribosyltransferase PARP14-like isoform X2 [Hemicordylus capensis]XP_053103122.1 protein mono-ADP-ribosyltransferase PARP14-like isoform X2 [Hemicordylus capensis]XP_053103132.1 protein mono-ADP-ribosyltransferase PARP14-like isoform X2 [Hemicordylus capensis]